MAKKLEPETNNLTQGSNFCQPQSVNEIEDIVESRGSSAMSSVENTGLSDSAGVQSKGSSYVCSMESPLMNGAVHFVDENAEMVLENTDTDVECRNNAVKSKGLSPMSSVENRGLFDSAGVQSKGSSYVGLTESPLMSSSVLSVDEDVELILENTETDIECQGSSYCQPQSFSEIDDTVKSQGLSATLSVENTGLSDSAGEQSKGSSCVSSTECPLMNGAVLSADEDAEMVLENTDIDVECRNNAVESQGLSATSSVENTGLSNSVGVLSKGLSNAGSTECPLMNGAVRSVDEDAEMILDNTDTDVECENNNAECELETSAAGEVSTRELLTATVAQESLANDKENLPSTDESDLPHAEDVTISEEHLTQKAVSNTTPVEDETVAEDISVFNTTPVEDETVAEDSSMSDGGLGKLLSCAECGSSGWFFPVFLHFQSSLSYIYSEP